MIRREFLKALMASPLGFLIPKATGKKKESDHPLYCWTPSGDSNLPFNTALNSTYDDNGIYTGCWWKVADAKWAEREKDRSTFTVYKDGKVIDRF